MRQPSRIALLALLASAAACSNPAAETVGDDAGTGTGDCVGDSRWTCDGEARVRCVGSTPQREACGRGCLASSGEGDAVCVEPDASWSCADSEYQGQQYWTCDSSTGQLHRCDADGGVVAACEAGCATGPVGTDDACRIPGTATAIPLPVISFEISSGLTEAQLRGPIEEGVRKTLDLVVQTMDIAPDARVPPITLRYTSSNQGFCSGIASPTSADIACPSGYPVTGDNQNFVVNLSIHEVGHVIARQLLNAQAHVDTCENEGLATWMAKSYWANFQSSPVGTLGEAARREIDAGRASASMTNCILASDAPYKVYGSFFEYLETIPGAAQRITNGQTTSAEYVAGWHTWLGR
jgi:hypothetical protein